MQAMSRRAPIGVLWNCDWGCKKTSQSKKECWCGYKLHLDVIDGDSSLANRRRIRKPRSERREGRRVPENHDFLPSDGAKTVTPTASTIFPCRTPRGARLQAGTTRGSASASIAAELPGKRVFVGEYGFPSQDNVTPRG